MSARGTAERPGRLGWSALSGFGSLALIFFCAVFVAWVAFANLNPDPKGNPSWEPDAFVRMMSYAAWVVVPAGVLLAISLPPLALGLDRPRSLLVALASYGTAFGLLYALEGSSDAALALTMVPVLTVPVASLLTNSGRASLLVVLAAALFITATYLCYAYVSAWASAPVVLAGWLLLPPIAGAFRPCAGTWSSTRERGCAEEWGGTDVP